MAPLCSVNVTKQNPVFVSHTKKNMIIYWYCKMLNSRLNTFDFRVLSSCGHKGSIRRVSHSAHRIKMALLLHYIRLTLPFPYKKLPQSSASKSNPITSIINCNGTNFLIRDFQGMNQINFRHLVKKESTMTVASDKELGGRVIRGRG